MAVFANIIYNILEYISKSLNLQILIYLYNQILDLSNITYIVKEITQKSFKKLDVFSVMNFKDIRYI